MSSSWGSAWSYARELAATLAPTGIVGAIVSDGTVIVRTPVPQYGGSPWAAAAVQPSPAVTRTATIPLRIPAQGRRRAEAREASARRMADQAGASAAAKIRGRRASAALTA